MDPCIVDDSVEILCTNKMQLYNRNYYSKFKLCNNKFYYKLHLVGISTEMKTTYAFAKGKY